LFNKDMVDVIPEKRFDVCKSGALCEKKECEILPHVGVLKTIISDINPYEGLECIRYDDLIDYANDTFSFDNFEILTY